MIRASSRPPAVNKHHTIWGLEPVQLHDRFWAARGVQVVRQGEPSEIVEDAELFLLTTPSVLTIFKTRQIVETLSWIKPVLLYVRLRHGGERAYREQAMTDAHGHFLRFNRLYDSNSSLTRVALTPDRDIALSWQTTSSPSAAWQQLRRSIPRRQCTATSISGHVYDAASDHDTMHFIRTLSQIWKRPDATIAGVKRLRHDAWASLDTQVDSETPFVGPVWVGAGRQLDAQTTVVGPAVLWDAPHARPSVPSLSWQDIEPSEIFSRPLRSRSVSGASRQAKRCFDVLFSSLVLALTLPLYPFVMLAIYLEDGRPWFFLHRRETMGGAQFSCIKFRSMCKEAEAVKAQLAKDNEADGPQFFIEDDPRLTRIGRLLRRMNIDELPQFINVLLGQMSVVGPRPSPFEENQYCPAWRETRLSIRPGITGLWQVKRRRREGMDFQEWIKYDIEYVENASWSLDLWIIGKTIPIILRGLLQ